VCAGLEDEVHFSLSHLSFNAHGENVIAEITTACGCTPQPAAPIWIDPVISGGIGLLGTCIGAGLVYLSTRKIQQDQWLRDSRKAEFSELLKALSQSYGVMISLRTPGRLLDGHDLTNLEEAEASALRTIRDRIFIADDVARDNILELWTNASKTFDDCRDFAKFRASYNLINEVIVKAAMQNSVPRRRRKHKKKEGKSHV
jgi:hypothetical protein